jgi:hypothetical protein
MFHPVADHTGPEGESFMTSALDGVGGKRHAPAAFTPGTDPVPLVQEAGCVTGPDWIGTENFAPTGIRSPDLPARSESLYRLGCPPKTVHLGNIKYLHKFRPDTNTPVSQQQRITIIIIFI